MSIAQNLEDIDKRICEAAEKSGRKRSDVLLLAVSKTIDIPRIKEAVALGCTQLGENRVQEIMAKYDEIPGVQWHLIGHLQTNKVKYIADKVKLIHSVDSLKLGKEISLRSGQAGRTMDVLVEVNMAGEESKSGVAPDEAEKLAKELGSLENICVKGLMTVAPYDPCPENNRIYFQKMKELFENIKSRNYANVDMQHLSMGMTNDYEVAVEEGADIVRIGTGIFGARDYGNKQ
ncbi:MAG: YggS family pyridoxal phosphate-dependent enzyme [Firmicutes bacterium]|nr:YggS family pyridoxal phosphate-dependent enzyme [Bacillota bacterium]